MKQPHPISVRPRLLLPFGLLLVGLLPPPAHGQGSSVSWGQVSSTPTGADFIQVAGGLAHSLALRADGSIVSWGDDFGGLVSNTPSGTGFTQVAGGYGHSHALHSDGSIQSWGANYYGVVSGTPGGTGFTQVAVGPGGTHAHALRTDGSMVSWGGDGAGQVSNTPAGTGFTQVAAGSGHSLALRVDGSIVAWGLNNHGQVSNTPIGTEFTQVSGGSDHSLALRADGSIIAWGLNNHGQVSNTPTETGFTQVAGGVHHSLALHVTAGEAFCFGDGSGNFCPCLNFGNAGEGCANSSGTGGATLVASGSAWLANDNFQLHVVGGPFSSPGLILRGTTQLNGGLGSFVGDGLLCTSGQTARSQVQFTLAGSTTFSDFQGSPFGASSYPGGVPTNYQYWYRDMANTCSGLGFNFSNAWTATWLP